MKKIKRIFLIFISFCIFGITIYSDYQTVKAVDIPTAFWGTLEAARAFWTALNAGGGVRGGGVSMATFEHSSREDMHELQTQVMIAYTAFCIWKEKAQLKIDHPDWSEDEINQQAEVNGRLASDRFQNSAINVTDTTKNLTIKDYGYWKEFCSSFNSIAKNGLGGSLDSNTTVRGKVSDLGNKYNFENLENIGSNTFEYNGYNYIFSGQYRQYQNSNWIIKEYVASEVATDRVRIPFIYISRYSSNIVDYYKEFIDVNRLTGQIITSSAFDVLHGLTIRTNEFDDIQNSLVSQTSFPVIINLNKENFDLTNFDYEKYLCVSEGKNNEVYEQDIENALDSTEAGKAIKEGAKDGQEEIIKSGSIPVKRSSVRTGEETATGVVGWDVPDARTLEGAIAVPDNQDDVVEGMGIISVPEDIVTPKDEDTVAEWAKDEPISIPDTRDEPISKPIDLKLHHQ